MNRILRFMFVVAAALCVFTGCDDSDPYYGPGISPETNKVYSNKTGASERQGSLDFSYNDLDYYGAEVYVQYEGDNTATVKILGVMPWDKQATIENVKLNMTESGYSFSGSAKTPVGTTFSYTGNLVVATDEYGKEEEKLSVSLSDINMPANPLLTYGVWSSVTAEEILTGEDIRTDFTEEDIAKGKYQGYNYYYDVTPDFIELTWKIIDPVSGMEENFFDFRTADGNLFAGHDLIENVLKGLIYALLQDIVFLPDGNLGVHYSGLPSDASFFLALIAGGSLGDFQRENVTYVDSKNFAFYYFDGEYVHVRPNLENIIAQLTGGNGWEIDLSSLDLGDFDLSGLFGGDLSLGYIIDLLETLMTWMSDGVKFRYEEVEPVVRTTERSAVISGQTYWNMYHYRNTLTHTITLEGSELENLLPLITMLLPVIWDQFRVGELLESVKDMEITIDITGAPVTITIGDLVGQILDGLEDRLLNYTGYTSEFALQVNFSNN
ncbi:MAG: DUF4925 domain-containing protein [Rikenellaceae bacterium]|nr:DUF4925 domain-containing protein [Rikenellaceae bacterium]